MKRYIGFLIIAIMISACAGSKVFTPTQTDVQRMSSVGVSTDLASLETGYRLYKGNCGGCHALVAPPSRSLQEWDHVLEKMFPKTQLTVEEQAKVKAYIVARR